jgi:hypothetical protein
MDGGVRFSRIGGVIATVYLLVAAPLASVVHADPSVPATYFAPIPTPSIETQSFALRYAAPKFDLGAIDTSKFRKEPLPSSFDKLELGTSALQLNIADTTTQPAPGTTDLTDVIVPLPPGKKRATRRYFGLTLTTPTH